MCPKTAGRIVNSVDFDCASPFDFFSGVRLILFSLFSFFAIILVFNAHMVDPDQTLFANFQGILCGTVGINGLSINELPHDKTNKITCAPSEDSGQPGHPPSLISFAGRMKT